MLHKLTTKTRRTRRGFTLIELLVVVLILAILMAVALPLYLNAVADSERKTCRSNMQTIANAEQAYKVANVPHVYTTTVANLLPNLQALPTCPTTGTNTYTVEITGTAADGRAVPAGGFAVDCPGGAAVHGSFIPGVDSQ